MNYKELIPLLKERLPEFTADENQLFNQLSAYINSLITNNFNDLVQLLYNIDVSEKKLKETLKAAGDTDASNIIATLILERLHQKITYKKNQPPANNTATEEEKW